MPSLQELYVALPASLPSLFPFLRKLGFCASVCARFDRARGRGVKHMAAIGIDSRSVGKIQSQRSSSPRSKVRTLVVDDSPTILHAICSLLEDYRIVHVVGRA